MTERERERERERDPPPQEKVQGHTGPSQGQSLRNSGWSQYHFVIQMWCYFPHPFQRYELGQTKMAILWQQLAAILNVPFIYNTELVVELDIPLHMHTAYGTDCLILYMCLDHNHGGSQGIGMAWDLIQCYWCYFEYKLAFVTAFFILDPYKRWYWSLVHIRTLIKDVVISHFEP